MRRQQQASAGFTLVEVLVAMVIFAIASLAVSSLIVKSTQLISENNLSTQAIAIAQDQVEKLRDMPVATMADLASTTTSNKGTITFNINRDIIQNIPITGVNTLVITVTWTQRGVTKSYETRTIFTQVS
jgi:prepilin-type N-terminal cleavage/methylation domain-containing protein